MTKHIAVILSTIVLLAGLAAGRPAAADCTKPGLLIVLDKSSSMVRFTFPSGDTKWDVARTAVRTLTSTFQTSIDFGLAVFPNPDECDPGSVVVTFGPDRSDEIDAYLGTPPPNEGYWTPMSQTLTAVAAYPPLSDAALTRVVVLVTDGWQWCSPYDPATRFAPVAAAADVRATGATLYVIGFGDSVDSLTLNRIASQSGTGLPGCNVDQDDPAATDNCYVQANDLTGLTTALDAIARHLTEEVCDGVDSDCDGQTDEGLERSCATLCGSGVETCEDGAWVDCTAVKPVTEVCEGSRDEDCDTVVDEGCECTVGDTRPCGTDVGECAKGTQSCVLGTWSECVGAVWPAEETCDGLDNDCNGGPDNGAECPAGEVCRDGQCVGDHADVPEETPAGGDGPAVNEKEGCGCSVVR